jgi:nucleotide-binding universal stress UspA family protein
MAVHIDLVLAPVDNSEASMDAAEYATAVAREYDADLHLLHVLDERVVQGLDTDDLSPDTVAAEQRSFAGSVRHALPDEVGFSQSSVLGFSLDRLRQSPGSVILDAADELDADFLVVPREQSTHPEAVLGNASLHVLEYASQPVLSV